MRLPSTALLRLYGALAALPALALGTTIVFYTVAYDGRIYPNVAVGGVDVGGLSLSEARAALRAAAGDLLARPLAVSEGAGVRPTLGALGVALPPAAIERATSAAHAVGRVAPHDLTALIRQQLLLWQHGEQLPLTLELDAARARAALDQIATYVERPAANAHLDLVLTEQGYEVHTLPAVTGERVDREATLARLRAWLGSGLVLGSGAQPLSLEIVVVTIPPAVTDADVEALRAQIDAVVGAPLVFRRDDGESWSVEPPALASAVRLEGLDPVAYYARPAGDVRPALVLEETRLAALVNAVADLADRPPEEPALEARGERVMVRAGRVGQLVDREAALTAARETLAAAGAAGAAGTNRVVQLRTTEQPPLGQSAALEPAAEWLNERLALPLLLEYQGDRRLVTRADMVRLLAPRANPPGLDRAAVRAFLASALPSWIRLESTQGIVEPSLELRGGRVEIVPGRPGQSLDLDALAAELAARFTFSDPSERVVAVAPVLTPPRLSIGDLIPARDAAQIFVSGPVRLYSPAGDWLVPAETLAGALRFERAAPVARPSAVLDRARLAAALATIGRDAETRAASLGLRDALGRPLVFDPLATADEVIDGATAPADERYAPLRWRNET